MMNQKGRDKLSLDQFLDTPKPFYTIGYEGRDFGEFVAIIKCHPIRRIVDIRRNPVSKNPAFSKIELRHRLRSANIEYLHSPEFAPPTEIRKIFQSSNDFTNFSILYRRFLHARKAQISLWEKSLHDFDCFLCYEKKHTQCHRLILCELLNRPVINL